MKRTIFLLLVSVMTSVCALAQTPKTIKLTNDVPYRDGSPACVLDIADPQDFGSTGLRPALVIIHGGGWSMGSKNVDVYRGLTIDYALQAKARAVELEEAKKMPFRDIWSSMWNTVFSRKAASRVALKMSSAPCAG